MRPTTLAQAGPFRRKLRIHPTTAVERLLLVVTVVLLPLQDHMPVIGGFSMLYLIFGVIGTYVLIRRPNAFGRTMMHPVFLTLYGWLLVGFVIESLHPEASFSELFRIMQMVVAAVFVASLCRDRAALRAALYGYLIAGVWMSLFLFATTYGALSGVTATDYGEATRVQSEIIHDNPFQEGLKQGGFSGLAFVAAQGTVVALGYVLTTRSYRWRLLCLGILLFCGVATFLPMSRGGIAIAALTCSTVMYAYGVMRIRTLVVALVLGTGILFWVPNAVYSRLTFSTEPLHSGRTEARARLLLAAVENLPEYIIAGVGAGNFWRSWAKDKDFFRHGTEHKSGTVQGAHNSFIQVTVYWGLVGLLPLLAVIYQAYRCLPVRCGADGTSLCLLGIALTLLLLMLVIHVLADKSFSLGLGLLVSAHMWIWPQGKVHPIRPKHRPLRALSRPFLRPTADGTI
jgi:hypothetical protein